ncbi:MAG: GAF domain-containing protein [Anaerolineae bacterium]|nr:GAF domain-containing protein [Anaerolineae bacterium]
MKRRIKRTKTGRSLVAILVIAFFALSALTLLISSGLQLALNFQIQRDTIASQQRLIAQDASGQVSSFIQEKFGALEASISLINPVVVSPAMQRQILDSLLGVQPAFREIVLLDAQSQELVYVSRVSLTPSEQFTAQLTDDMLAQTRQGQRYISPIYIEQITNEPLVTLAVPVTDALRDFQGVLAAEVNLKFMWDLVDRLEVGETGWAYVVDRQGTLIAFRETDRVLRGENVRGIVKVDQFINSTELIDTTSSELYTGIRGTEVAGTFIALGMPDWAVVVEIPWQEAYWEVIRGIGVSAGTTLIMAVLAGLIGAYLARRMAVPLIDLTKTATRIAAGETALQAEVAGPSEVASLATAFNSMTQQLNTLISGLEQRVDERTRDLARRSSYLEATTRVVREASATLELEDLLPRIANLIGEQFDFYHIGIFLADPAGEWVELRAASSEGGQRMLQRKHRLRIEDMGIVGYAANRGEPRIALDTDADIAFLHNPDLPATRSEAALPLRARGKIIGVLDVQSTAPEAFTDEDVAVLQTLADQVALAIDNARLFAQAEETLEIQRQAYGESSQRAWTRLLSQATLGFVSIEQGVSPAQELWEPQMREALHTGKPIVADAVTLAVPIQVRGQVIGVLDITQPDDDGSNAGQWTPEQIATVQTVADQLGVALESARLYQDTQRRAAQEQLVGEVTARIRESLDMETVLKTATREMGRSLGLDKITIHLGTAQE